MSKRDECLNNYNKKIPEEPNCEVLRIKKWCDDNLPALGWNMIILQKLNQLRMNQGELLINDLLYPSENTRLTLSNMKLLKIGIEEFLNESKM